MKTLDNKLEILIIDDESDILDIITFFIEDKFTQQVNIKTAPSGFDAIELLKSKPYDLCICDHNMPNGLGSDVYKYIIDNHLPTKFVLCSSIVISDMPKQYSSENIYYHIIKPEIESGVEKLFNMISAEKGQSSTQLQPISNYVPVMVNLLFLLQELPCDIYLSLSENKFVKCLNTGESFSEGDRNKYNEKGVQKLFVIRGADEQKILNLINTSLFKIMANKNKPLGERIFEVHSKLTSLLKLYGISEELAGLAKDSIKNTVGEILKNEKEYRYWERLNLMGEYPSKLYTLQAILCGILTKKISWCSEPTLHKLVMSSFFQDMTLDSIELMKIKDYSEYLEKSDKMTSKQKDNYMTHPNRSKEIISKIKDAPTDIDKILLEQHEMPNGEGFPRKMNATQIGPLSAMFITTGIMAKIILEEEEKLNPKEMFNLLESKGYNKGNFKEIFTSLRSLFTIE
jgi:response regulator RpfG family c-di-GMP phosphodiesterase